jgi:hypothetical protein
MRSSDTSRDFEFA